MERLGVNLFQQSLEAPQQQVQIFISHSSRDTIIMPLVSQIQGFGIYTYLAEYEPAEAKPLPDKIKDAIANSKSAFVFITKNVLENKDTRDIILWELGIIHAYRLPTYVFVETDVEEVPKPVGFYSVYNKYDPNNPVSLTSISGQIRGLGLKISVEIKQREDTRRNEDLAKLIAGIFIVGLGALALSQSQ